MERVNDNIEPPAWICAECAADWCVGMPKGHLATYHMGQCGVCHEMHMVTEPRDYRGMTSAWWKMMKTNNHTKEEL